MDPTDSRIIYAGTGEGYFREIVRGTGLPLRGEGILKTVDGGDSWERLAGTSNSDFYWVNDLVISRSDPRRIYAATRTGVWRSADAGRNWSRILIAEDVTGGCLDLALRTDLSSDYLFAACGTFQQATVYLATNFSGSDAGLELIPFRDDGARLNSVFMNASAGQSVILPASNLFDGAAISHFGVCGPQSLRVTSACRSLLGQSASAHAPETSVMDTRFLFYPGEGQVVFEGMAVVNRGATAGRVEAVLLDAAGNEVRRVSLIDSLAPGAKQLAVLNAAFDGFAGVAIRIECSEPSSILLLRGTHPSLQPGVLFQTVPIAVTPRR
jgi:hypothetical protein